MKGGLFWFGWFVGGFRFASCGWGLRLWVFGLIVDGSQFGGFLLLGFAFSLFNVGCLVGGLLALLVANCGGVWFRVAVLVLGCLGG